MPRVGHQCRGVGKEAISELDGDEDRVQRDRDRERAAMVGRVAMVMMVPMPARGGISGGAFNPAVAAGVIRLRPLPADPQLSGWR